MSDRPTPRPKNARVQSPPSRVDASTPESIVRLLSDLKLHSGPPLSGPTPDTSSSSSLASQPASTKASSGRTASASALNVVRGTALRDPFDVDGPTAAGASASSSGVPASRLSVRTVSSSRQWGSVKDVDSQSVSELSVAWTDDLASSTIENFMTDTISFMSGPDQTQSKLQLWQSLCIEFGFCALPPSHITFDRPAASESDSSSIATVLPTKSTTAGSRAHQGAHPFPTSLTSARKLLKGHAHVNLRDYMKLRAKLRKAKDASQVAAVRGRIKALNFPSAQALRKYTIENQRFYSLGEAKAAWLNPLLIDM